MSDLNKAFKCVGIKSVGAPGDSQLAKINRYALVELKADDVYVRSFYVAHNGIDRDLDVMDEALLVDLAKTLPGKGLFNKHPLSRDGDSGPGEGRWFEAKTVHVSNDKARELLKEPNLQFLDTTNEAVLVQASAYMLRDTSNDDLIKKIDGGVAGAVSLGFRHGESKIVQGNNGETIAYRLHAPGEAMEGALVWMGAQQGAHAFKSAKSGPCEHCAKIQKELADANSEIKGLKRYLDMRNQDYLNLLGRGEFSMVNTRNENVKPKSYREQHVSERAIERKRMEMFRKGYRPDEVYEKYPLKLRPVPKGNEKSCRDINKLNRERLINEFGCSGEFAEKRFPKANDLIKTPPPMKDKISKDLPGSFRDKKARYILNPEQELLDTMNTISKQLNQLTSSK